MFEQHWLEAGCINGPGELDLNLNTYFYNDSRGRQIFMVLEEGDEILGYMSAFVVNPIHHRQTKVAEIDAFYIKPEHRLCGYGADLFMDFEDYLTKVVQVDFIRTFSNNNNDVSGFLEGLGYKAAEVAYHKLTKEK